MIVQILSAAYSGSTLLDAMLDSQPGIHGLGELAQLWEDKPKGVRRGPCHLCGTEVHECSFWQDYREGPPARWALERLPGGIVVDSSKAPHRFHPGDQPAVSVLIAKAPHEWAHSVLGHDGHKYTLEQAWEEWESLHAGFLNYLTLRERWMPLIYSDLTMAPCGSLEEICEFLRIPPSFDPIDTGAMWNRKSHALGGNPAVIDQLAQNENQTGGRAKWMAGKYAGDRWRAIRYDDAWVSDDSFRGRCAGLYLTCSHRMRRQLEMLGLGTAEELADSMICK